MTDQEILKEIYLSLRRLEGYMQGSTQGLVSRLDSIDKNIEEIRLKKESYNDAID